MGNCGSECGAEGPNERPIRRHTESEMLLTYLTDKELNLITTTWPMAKQQHPEFCVEILMEILNRSVKVRQIFDVSDADLLVRPIHPKIIGQANSIENFLNELIKDLSEDRVVQLCTSLGAKHLAYRKSGFQPVYWDIFTASMIDKFQSVEVKGETKLLVINAWQKFWKFVVGTMYAAYEHSAMKHDGIMSKKSIQLDHMNK